MSRLPIGNNGASQLLAEVAISSVAGFAGVLAFRTTLPWLGQIRLAMANSHARPGLPEQVHVGLKAAAGEEK